MLRIFSFGEQPVNELNLIAEPRLDIVQPGCCVLVTWIEE
jgi:hypothetical protein